MMALSAPHYDQANGLNSTEPCMSPCEKPVCCSKKKNFPKGRQYISLISNVCSYCQGTCPQQNGDPCGGESENLVCDTWLRCHRDTCKDTLKESCVDGKQITGRCVPKYHVYTNERTQRETVNTKKLIRPETRTNTSNLVFLGDRFTKNKFSKAKNGSSAGKRWQKVNTRVPVCELIKGEKTCRCVDQEKDNELISNLADEYKWCFVSQIIDAKNPTSNCFADVKWSATAGRFWSYMAFNHTYGGM